MTHTTTRLAALAALPLTALGAAACGSEEPSSAPAAEMTDSEGGTYNEHDVAFAQQMIPHHAQALVLVDLTAGRDLSPEVRSLADDVAAAQAPEVETMTGWLTLWHEEVPETMRDHVNMGHAHPGEDEHGSSIPDMPESHADMPGMLTTEELEEIAGAEGAEFEQAWLEAMAEHHEGAIEMAEEELERGVYPPAQDLAEQVIETQQAEIDTIEQLLG